MTLRTIHSVAAVVTLTSTVLGGTALPARAGNETAGVIQLTMSKEGPIWTDNNSLIYKMRVTNAGPHVATGIVVHVSGLFCGEEKWEVAACTALPDRDDPGKVMSVDVRLGSIAPGESAGFPVEVLLPNEDSGSVRTTVEVVSSDQYDSGSVPGSCVDGLNPQADCVSDVLALT